MLKKILAKSDFRHQLTILVGLLILCTTVVFALVTAYTTTGRIKASLIDRGHGVASTLAQGSVLSLLYKSPGNADQAIASALADQEVVRAEIIDADRTILLTRSKDPEQLLHKDLRDIDFESHGLSWETDDFLSFLVPVKASVTSDDPFELNDVTSQHLGYVHVLVTKRSLNQLVSSLIASTVLIALLSTIVLVAILKAVTKTLSQPLATLSDLMDKAGMGQLGIRASPVGARDIHNMALAFNRMMAELENRETALRQSRDEALREGILKAQFSATVSQEVKAPLAGLVGMLNLMKQHPLPDQQRAYLEVAARTTHSLTELLNDILDFSRMKAGKIELDLRDFDLHKLIEDVIDLFGKQAHRNGVYVGYSIEPSVPDRINGDPIRLRQVLTNLVSNAVKFTDSGEIALRVSAADCHERSMLLFTVTDTGIGLTEDEAKHVFDTFGHTHRASASNRDGSGLGLAISKQLVELMGGKITASGEKGKGSSFSFTIKFSPGLPIELDDEHPLLFDTRVLIIDESQMTIDLIAGCLSRRGMRCESCRHGYEGLEILIAAAGSADPFKVVIADSTAVDDQGEFLIDRLDREMRSSGLRLLVLDLYAPPHQPSTNSGHVRLGPPLTQARLYDAVENALESQSALAGPTSATAAPAYVKPLQRLHALVIESNKTNQVVITGMLELTGCASRVVDNIDAALGALALERFDFVLMACEIAGSSGLEATRQLRAFEASIGRRTPVIGMSTDRGAGHQDDCQVAGMDDLIEKPITLDVVKSALVRLAANHTPTKLIQPSLFQDTDIASQELPILDSVKFGALGRKLGEHRKDVVASFLANVPMYLDELEHALSQDDMPTARELAIAVKDSCTNLGAFDLAALAAQCEVIIEPGLLSQMRTSFNKLKGLLDQLQGTDEASDLLVTDRLASVLVVDDDRPNRLLAKRLLQDNGYDVHEAHNATDAFAILETMNPEVILISADMPETDGFAACKRIQQLHPALVCPMIIMSGHENATSVERAFSAGAADYISKASLSTALLQRIKRVVATSQAISKARIDAGVDQTTQLPNRATFLQNVSNSLPEAGPTSVAVLYVDIDKFSTINESHGYDIGDKLLADVGRRLVRFTSSRNLAARLNGGQFAVLLRSLATETAAGPLAQAVCSAIAQPFDIDGQSLFVTATVGVALHPQNGTDAGILLRHAHAASKSAKQTGSNYLLYHASMDPQAYVAAKIHDELRDAFDRHEFTVLYQPIVEATTMHVVGVEALLRWTKTAKSICLPVEFIGAAIESGLIHRLGQWMLQDACRQVQAWRENGWPELTLTVNVSSEELLHQDFIETLDAVIAESRLPCSSLFIDLPEHFLNDNPEQAVQITKLLNRKGIKLAVDDFGTGFSSLSYLAQYPVRTVKIDRAFVRDVPRSTEDTALLKMMIDQAHRHGMKVVAEGVETEAQHAFLRQQGCDLIQGYHTGVPSDPETIYARLTKQRAVSPTDGEIQAY